MLLTQGVPYIDREQLGLSYISCPSLLRFRGPRHDNINLYISLYIVDHYLNIDLLELYVKLVLKRSQMFGLAGTHNG